MNYPGVPGTMLFGVFPSLDAARVLQKGGLAVPGEEINLHTDEVLFLLAMKMSPYNLYDLQIFFE